MSRFPSNDIEEPAPLKLRVPAFVTPVVSAVPLFWSKVCRPVIEAPVWLSSLPVTVRVAASPVKPIVAAALSSPSAFLFVRVPVTEAVVRFSTVPVFVKDPAVVKEEPVPVNVSLPALVFSSVPVVLSVFTFSIVASSLLRSVFALISPSVR